MRGSKRDCQAGRRGAAMATELAILLPFISLMFLIALDFCRLFYCSQTVQNCAECGALYASGTVQPTPQASIPQSLLQTVTELLFGGNSHKTPTDAELSAYQAALAEGASLNPPLQAQDISIVTANGQSTVTVTYQFQTFASYPGLPSQIAVTRSVDMAVAPTPGH